MIAFETSIEAPNVFLKKRHSIQLTTQSNEKKNIRHQFWMKVLVFPTSSRLPLCLTFLDNPWSFSGRVTAAPACTAVTETSHSRLKVWGSTGWWTHHLSSSAHLYTHMNKILKWTLLALWSVNSVCNLVCMGVSEEVSSLPDTLQF